MPAGCIKAKDFDLNQAPCARRDSKVYAQRTLCRPWAFAQPTLFEPVRIGHFSFDTFPLL